ncbi:uncharacterized metal-binding protein YceD (DUF177 family) [Sphingobacterium alimentarium]|uniref:Uncharacterized metal-binding protein YceD (DUF177 family) n=1 Tax=Sphingobacterium alimentarium TaxID=797292 RepID=A0A4R3VWN9_9SPHI|nr:DUF177 domain-containing protein [Sphingobacterium alimentarium]TCV20363.1 uncharacterized metal-binding protein YceD (DUF177 family) [Sphingobacterium alimentarium]
MKYLKQYRIPFSGLAAGKHDFEFEINDKFFDCYEHSLVKKGELTAKVSLQKQEGMLIVNFDINGTIKLTCDVCLAEFDAPVSFQERLIVKFVNEEWDQETDEVIILNKTDHELDIATLLYEYINVQVPYYAKCSEQGVNITCDPEMLAKISTEEDTQSDIETENIDPRWAALKNIKNN